MSMSNKKAGIIAAAVVVPLLIGAAVIVKGELSKARHLRCENDATEKHKPCLTACEDKWADAGTLAAAIDQGPPNMAPAMVAELLKSGAITEESVMSGVHRECRTMCEPKYGESYIALCASSEGTSVDPLATASAAPVAKAAPVASTISAKADAAPLSKKDIAAKLKTMKSTEEADPLVSTVEMPVEITPSASKFFSNATVAKNCYTLKYSTPEPSCYSTLTIAQPLGKFDASGECVDADGADVGYVAINNAQFNDHTTGDKVRISLSMHRCWADGGVALRIKAKKE